MIYMMGDLQNKSTFNQSKSNSEENPINHILKSAKS